MKGVEIFLILQKRLVLLNFIIMYRKISNTIRTIFTKNRGPAAGVRIIHLN